MKLTRRALLHLAAGTAAVPAVSGIACGQVYPSRPVTLILPFAAGGSGDTIARIIGERLRVSLGQPVIIENVAGASGTIAGARVARAAGDGYTLTQGNWATHVLNGAMFTLQYDLFNEFQPISLLATESLLVVGRKTLPANDFNELISWLKANPDKASAGTGGSGSVAHVVGAFFQRETGTRFTFVPYRGLGPAMQDLVAGQIDIMFDTAANSLPQVRAGNVKVYAITAPRRLPDAPEIPTANEAGLPGFFASNWRAIWAPKGTPAPIVGRLNSAIREVLADANVRQRLQELGQEIVPDNQQTPDALRTFHRAEIDKWWPIIKAAGIKAE
jgi:tripartite-type tricarboxylate transporter receptor subunit TctC